MPKIITSPVKHFPGTVTLSDPLTFSQCFAIEDALEVSLKLEKETTLRRYYYALLPGVLACIEKWELDNFPAIVARENFPASPKKPVSELISWLIAEISKLYLGEVEIPNV